MQTKTEKFTFKDTGVSVEIRKVSPMLGAQLVRIMPPPKPPMQDILDEDTGKVLRREPNRSHPDYLEKLNEYNTKLNDQTQKILIERGVVTALGDEEKAAVKELREWWADNVKEGGKATTLPESDKLVYIMFIAAGSLDDIEELTSAILFRSQPTEEGQAQAKDLFPDKV